MGLKYRGGIRGCSSHSTPHPPPLLGSASLMVIYIESMTLEGRNAEPTHLPKYRGSFISSLI